MEYTEDWYWVCNGMQIIERTVSGSVEDWYCVCGGLQDIRRTGAGPVVDCRL